MRRSFALLVVASLLVGCQSHLPVLDRHVPTPSSPPTTNDVVDHIQCELAQIINAPLDNKELAKRLQAASDQPIPPGQPVSPPTPGTYDKLSTLLPLLVKYNFVATAQITLEVTDMQGLTAALSFMNAAATHVVGVGGQWNGTQDRSVTINYSIDLAHLLVENGDYKSVYCRNEFPGSGISGNLGMADIVADGLIALNEAAKYNIYGSSGPTPTAVAKLFNQGGKITADPNTVVTTPLSVTVESLVGSVLFAPQSASSQTPSSVALNAIATLKDGGVESHYIASLTGSIVPPDSAAQTLVYFSLSGSLVPEPGQPLSKETTPNWGFNPTLNLTGSINKELDANMLKLEGILVPAAGSKYGKTGSPMISVSLPDSQAAHAAQGASASSVKGGASGASGAAGGTSFGSLVDFLLVYGLNGSPSYTFQNVKGVTGMGAPFVNAMRTHTDSVAITFVATCQKSDQISQFNPTDYWHSIGPCDQFGTAHDQALSFGYQNNSLMFLRQLTKP